LISVKCPTYQFFAILHHLQVVVIALSPGTTISYFVQSVLNSAHILIKMIGILLISLFL